MFTDRSTTAGPAADPSKLTFAQSLSGLAAAPQQPRSSLGVRRLTESGNILNFQNEQQMRVYQDIEDINALTKSTAESKKTKRRRENNLKSNRMINRSPPGTVVSESLDVSIHRQHSINSSQMMMTATSMLRQSKNLRTGQLSRILHSKRSPLDKARQVRQKLPLPTLGSISYTLKVIEASKVSAFAENFSDQQH